MIEAIRQSSQSQISDAREYGVLAGSWTGWKESYAGQNIYLFLEGFAAPNSTDLNASIAQTAKICGDQIVDLYNRKGSEFISLLRGSFAIALWDARQKQLVLGTDHFGTRSIYYWANNDQMAFSPRIGTLVDCPEIAKVIEPNSIYFYLNHSFIPAPFTIYKNIRRLEPGHVLRWKNGQISVRRYWDMTYLEDKGLSEAAAAAGLRSALEDSVRFAFHIGAPRDEQVGAFLSGGTDSSVVVGLLSQVSASQARSFSVGFDEAAYNEIHYARAAAKHFDSDAYEYFVRPEEALAAMPTLASAFDEPFGNSSAIPTFFCLRTARDAGVKFMLAGDGGDELFGGNERYITEKVFALYQEIPRPLKTAIDRTAEIIPGFYPWRKVKNYVRKANQTAVERFFAYQLYFRDYAREYLTDELRQAIDLEFPLDVPKQHYMRAGDIAALNRLLYIDLKLAVADNDLFKVNRMAEINGIEVRYPYLDPQVGIVSGRIPARLKVKGWSKRYVFKKAFENFLPKEILRKKKHGFGLPTGDWLRRHAGFRDLAHSLLLDSRSVRRGYFKAPALERLLQLHDAESSSYYGSHIWNFMMLELWHRHHADQSPR